MAPSLFVDVQARFNVDLNPIFSIVARDLKRRFSENKKGNERDIIA